jgi:hypothetical protein
MRRRLIPLLLKGLGGLLAAGFLASGLLILVQDSGPGPSPPPPQWLAVPNLLLGVLGLVVFLIGDRKLKAIEGQRIKRTLADELRIALVLVAAIAVVLLFVRD